MMRSIGPILVLSGQPVVAALVGMLVELTGNEPVFARAGERYVDALQRVRPLAVVLIDIELDETQSDIFFAAAAKRQVGVALFGPGHLARRVAEIAAARSTPWFIVPPEIEHLSAALEAAAKRGDRAVRGEDRRARPETAVAADGTTILRDATGRRWMVYDRRAGARRQIDEDAIADGDRVFVCETGLQVTCSLATADGSDWTAETLDRQLARAMRS